MCVTDADRDEAASLGITPGETADGFMDLGAFLEAAAGDTGLEFFQALGQGATLAATYGTFLVTPRPAARQEIIDALAFVPSFAVVLTRVRAFVTSVALALEGLDLHVGIVGQALPAGVAQLVVKRDQRLAVRRQKITPPRFTEEGQALVADHAAVHDPDTIALAETCFDGVDDALDGLHIARVAGPGVVSQREAFARHHQGDHDLLAVAAMVARVAVAGQVVVLGQALEVAAGQVVQQQIVLDLEENTEAFLEVILDLLLAAEQLRQRAVQAILGDGAVRDTEEFFESCGSVPVLGEGELAAGLAQAIDDLDGHHVGGSHRFLALRHMPADNVVQAKVVPQPTGQPDIAEATGVGPAHGG